MPVVLEPDAAAFDLTPRSLFVSYHGVITLVYDGWPDGAMGAKVCNYQQLYHISSLYIL